jgi:hypothetical protein
MTTQMNNYNTQCAAEKAAVAAERAAELAISPECAAATTAYYNAQDTGNNFDAAWAEYNEACVMQSN